MSAHRFRQVVDHVGRKVDLPIEPQRIVSLCPSQTETLFDLGLRGRIVGRTKYCIHPNTWVKNVPTVGGTKTIDFDAVEKLAPDLIIAEKEENPKESIEALSHIAPVYVTDVVDVASALKMVKDLGIITQTESRAAEISKEIRSSLGQCDGLLTSPRGKKPKVITLIWKDPFYAVGANTYIDSVVEWLGCENPVKGLLTGRYPEISLETIRALQPDWVFLTTEPYPFKERQADELQLILPKSKVFLVEGELLSWYGTRMRLLGETAEELVETLLIPPSQTSRSNS